VKGPISTLNCNSLHRYIYYVYVSLFVINFGPDHVSCNHSYDRSLWFTANDIDFISMKHSLTILLFHLNPINKKTRRIRRVHVHFSPDTLSEIQKKEIICTKDCFHYYNFTNVTIIIYIHKDYKPWHTIFDNLLLNEGCLL